MPTRHLTLCFVIASALALGRADQRAIAEEAAAHEPAYKIAWTHETPQDGRDHIWEGVKYLPDSRQWIAVEKTLDGEKNRDGQYLLWRFAADGSVLGQTRIDDRLPETPAYAISHDVRAIFSLPRGELLIAGDIDGNERDVEFIRLDAHGDRLPEHSRGKQWSSLCAAFALKSESALLVAGSDTPGATAGEADLEGNFRWKQKYSTAAPFSTMRAVAYDPVGKTFLMAGQAGDWNKFGVGTANVWLLRCDDEGKLLEERTLEGHLHGATGLADGKLALIRSKRSVLEHQLNPLEPQRPLCVVIGADLKTIHETAIEFLAPPALAPLDSDRFLVAGYSHVLGTTLHVYQYNAAGEVARQLDEPLRLPKQSGIHWVDAAGDAEQACVALTLWHVEGKRQIRRGILYGLAPAQD